MPGMSYPKCKYVIDRLLAPLQKFIFAKGANEFAQRSLKNVGYVGKPRFDFKVLSSDMSFKTTFFQAMKNIVENKRDELRMCDTVSIS